MVEGSGKNSEGRPELVSDRPFFNISSLQDYESLRESIDKISKQDIVRRRELRVEDKEDRLEWVRHWQQKLVLLFIGFCLAVACVTGVWAMYIIFGYGQTKQYENAFRVYGILMESGIAAIIGFFAIKTFEK